MADKLEVSFNSPQCGWMSIGFDDSVSEYHTTTACAPHPQALSEILKVLAAMLDAETAQDDFVVAWSRNPEAYDLNFGRDGKNVCFQVVEYPTIDRLKSESEIVFSHRGKVLDFCRSFYQTFAQLYEDRDTDEFEFNWRQPFPFDDFKKFENKLRNYEL